MNKNDVKYGNYKKRKILRIFIIVFSLLTIILAVLRFVINLPSIFALISLIIANILNKKRKSIKL